jgi:hypothetical protein
LRSAVGITKPLGFTGLGGIVEVVDVELVVVDDVEGAMVVVGSEDDAGTDPPPSGVVADASALLVDASAGSDTDVSARGRSEASVQEATAMRPARATTRVR